MKMEQGVRTGLGHGGITCVLQTQFSSFKYNTKQNRIQLKSARFKRHNIVFGRPRHNILY